MTDQDVELAESVAASVLAVPGVSDLHAGMFGEVGTYLPGRTLKGIRVTPDEVDVHVVMQWGHDVRRLASSIQTALLPTVGGRGVTVTVEDVAAPGEPG